jgi:SAM-dependent methyltransferase|tara:strand:+ start:135 stop:905 length:771 start_codon:yes stop_codon:yes gene_type:complete
MSIIRSLYRRLESSKWGFFPVLFKSRKPKELSWKDYLNIQTTLIRYQPLVFPSGDVIPKKCCPTIIDSREKYKFLKLPQDFAGKSFLDIGCAEGFFVIQATARGAVFSRGCDMMAQRIDIANIVAGSWGFQEKTDFSLVKLYDIPRDYSADIVVCLAVGHHLHGGNHDTWAIISEPEKHADAFANMLKAVSAVAKLTKEKTYWEYCYEYDGLKPEHIDYTKLGRIWEEQKLYHKVEFKGLLYCTDIKDRAVYYAYK